MVTHPHGVLFKCYIKQQYYLTHTQDFHITSCSFVNGSSSDIYQKLSSETYSSCSTEILFPYNNHHEIIKIEPGNVACVFCKTVKHL